MVENLKFRTDVFMALFHCFTLSVIVTLYNPKLNYRNKSEIKPLQLYPELRENNDAR